MSSGLASPGAAEAAAQRRRLRELPPVHELVEARGLAEWLRNSPRPVVVDAARETLVEARRALSSGGESLADVEALAARAAERLEERLRHRLRRVVNATGVVLHTNLGRAPLAEEAIQHVADVAAGYSNLELDLSTGERGSRYAHVEELVCRLTGAEAAVVVNNNAGAVLLMLSALCRGREVVVSRGELVEIGGAFRVPDVMVQGGCRLVEVGTTNKTHLRDYEDAVGTETAALLKVHSSNFKIIGFTESPSLESLADLARRRGLPFLVDWGSGVLVDLEAFGLEKEATVREVVASGAELVTFSGDKLLGGPQAGFIVGRREGVDRCRRHPLTRALRIDKLTLAGLEATLRLYLDPERALRRVPTLRMLALGLAELQTAAETLAVAVRDAVPEARVEIADGRSQAGGGALPGTELPTVLVAVTPPRPVHEVEAGLRRHRPPVLARIQRGRILLDPRTLSQEDVPVVARALADASRSGGVGPGVSREE